MAIKKRLKLRKKRFAIFIICLFLLITGSIYSIKTIIKVLNKKPNIEERGKESQIQEEQNEEESTFSKIKYYKKEYEELYKSYQTKNPNLSIEEIVTDVNIGLSNPYYENSKPAVNLNTSYILVNKYNYLEETYEPENLQEISSQYALNGMKLVSYAKDAFEEMSKAAKKEGLSIVAMSTYRDYNYQTTLYNNYAKQDGKEKADTYSGRPGYSEHQTGLAVDVYNMKESYTNFEKTKEFTWMEENAYKYGFILRYPQNKEKETGYEYESWHYRYVGKEIAEYIKNNNISYEEYYIEFIEN